MTARYSDHETADALMRLAEIGLHAHSAAMGHATFEARNRAWLLCDRLARALKENGVGFADMMRAIGDARPVTVGLDDVEDVSEPSEDAATPLEVPRLHHGK